MKYIIKGLLCWQLMLAGMLPLQAQQPITLDFDSKGKLVSQPPNELRLSQNFIIKTKDPDFASQLKKSLAERVNQRLYDLQDDSLPYKALYIALWTQEGYNAMIKELDTLKLFLLDKPLPAASRSYIYTPSFNDLKSVFHTTGLFKIVSVDGSSLLTTIPGSTLKGNDPNTDQIKFRLQLTDPFKDWLIKYYNSSMSNSLNEMEAGDPAYRRSWDSLALLLNPISAHLGKLDSLLKQPVYDCSTDPAYSSARMLHTTIQDNPVVSLLRDGAFFKKWMWYFEGSSFLNPLYFTTPEKLLLKQTGDNRFVTVKQNDSFIVDRIAKNEKAAAQLQTVNKTVNHIQFPISSEKKLWHDIHFPHDTEKQVWLAHYDASKGYQARSKDLKAHIPDNEEIVLVANNVPANVKLTPVEAAASIPDKSPATIALDNLLDPIGKLVTDLAGVSGNWTRISSFLNPGPPKTNPSIEATPSVTISSPGAGTSSAAALPSKYADSRSGAKARSKVAPLRVRLSIDTTINEQQYRKDTSFSATRDIARDLQRISEAYSNIYMLEKEDRLLIDTYVLEKGFRLVYNPISFEQQVRNIVQSIKAFLLCRNSIRSLINELKNDSIIAAILARATDRSLPPDELQVATDTNAIYRSVVMLPKQHDAPQRIDYSIQQATIKPDGSESAATSVASGSYKIGKRHVVQLGGGIGYTIGHFTQRQVSEKDKVITTSSNSDRFRVIAGVHYYPWKDYLLNNKAIWNLCPDDLWHRFSIFGGVGIPKPLENYYLGLSADIWPGIRLNTGVHGFFNTKYKVVNNVITDKQRGVALAGMYTGITIEPSSLIKLLGFFK